MWSSLIFGRSQSQRTRRRACHEALEGRRLLSFAPAVSYAVGIDPESVVTADFNNDGHLDVATANAGANTFSVLLGNADARLGCVPVSRGTCPHGPG